MGQVCSLLYSRRRDPYLPVDGSPRYTLFVFQVAQHLKRNPKDGVQLLMDAVLVERLATEARKDPMARRVLAPLSGNREWSPAQALAFQHQLHLSKSSYQIAANQFPGLPSEKQLALEREKLLPGGLTPIYLPSTLAAAAAVLNLESVPDPLAIPPEPSLLGAIPPGPACLPNELIFTHVYIR